MVCVGVMSFTIPANAQVLPGFEDETQQQKVVKPMTAMEVFALYDLMIRTRGYDLYCNLGVRMGSFLDNYYLLREALFYRYSVKYPEKSDVEIYDMLNQMDKEAGKESYDIYENEGCDIPEKEAYQQFFKEMSTMEEDDLILLIEGNIQDE